MYTAEISRANPSCFLFLIDQSGSMADAWGSGESQHKKADGLADTINKLLAELTIKCAKEEGVRDYYHVGVIGYGSSVGPAFAGPLAGKDLVPISEVANNPARLESRVKKVSDNAGGLVDQTIKFPVWFEPTANGGTPMCQALTRAQSIVQGWLTQHLSCFPPIVINITDGEATDGDPTIPGNSLNQLASSDGNVLVFNIHLSSRNAPAIVFPDNEEQLPDDFARQLFRMSSVLPEHMRAAAQQQGIQVSPTSHGFVFQADLVSLIQTLDIGTRPSNLR
jgi:uncharacterized protein YegL